MSVYLQIALYGVVDHWVLCVVPPHQVLQCKILNGRLVVGLLCIHQHPDILSNRPLYGNRKQINIDYKYCTQGYFGRGKISEFGKS